MLKFQKTRNGIDEMQLTQILLSILWHFCTKRLPLAQPSLQTLGYLGPKVSYILGLLKTDFKPWYADLSILEAYLGHFNTHLVLLTQFTVGVT